MTVSELIEVLSKLPGHFPVVVNGYETGLEDIITPFEIKIYPARNGSGDTFDINQGLFGIWDHAQYPYEMTEAKDAVFIPGAQTQEPK